MPATRRAFFRPDFPDPQHLLGERHSSATVGERVSARVSAQASAGEREGGVRQAAGAIQARA